MFNIMLSSAIALHGIVHLMGFAKEWNLAPVGRFSGKTIIQITSGKSKFVGVLWLLACILLLTAAFSYYSEKDWFGIVAVCAVVLSQALIFVHWTNVKWASVVNAIILFLIFLAGGRLNFKHMVKEEVSSLIATSNGDSKVTDENISLLPNNVQVWLRKSNVSDQAIPKSVHIVQQGSMRTSANGKWVPFEAEQYFTIDPPGFIWKATIQANKFFDVVGRDRYVQGKGNMLIKAASLVNIADSKGREIDQGSMIRFMAEMIWFPQAAVSEYMKWEEIDETHARVTMTYMGTTASGIYTFNSAGFPIGFEAQRYGEFDGKFSKETWVISIHSYENFNGMAIGNKSEVTWKLKDGDYTWLKLELESIEYN